jgi:cytochrome c
MKHALIVVATGIAAALFQTAACAQVDADWAKAKAKEYGCLGCHDIDKKKVGPAWNGVAANYAGKTADDLAASIKSKPVHASVIKKAGDDLPKIAAWILTLK